MTSSTTSAAPQPIPSREQMVAKVVDWIIAGMRSSQIPEQAEKLGWGVSPEDVNRLILEANDVLWTDTRIDPKAATAKAIARLELLITRALAIQDYKTALSAQKELNVIVARATNPMLNPQ